MTSKEYLESKELSEKHRLNPTVGDYWSERCVPFMVVLDVVGDQITFCRERKSEEPGYWSWDFSKVETLPLSGFQLVPLYNKEYPERGMWCYVSPGKMMDVVKEYFQEWPGMMQAKQEAKDTHRLRTIKELDKLARWFKESKSTVADVLFDAVKLLKEGEAK